MKERFQIPEGIPDCPGVYRFLDSEGEIVYVGKAKNLRKRLAQYQKAQRRRRHRKMVAILKEAQKLEWEACPTELAALLREAELIRTIRPRKNVSGSYVFLYPFLGVWSGSGSDFRLAYTTSPQSLDGYRWYGAFRSRVLSKRAYLALRDLFTLVAFPEKISKAERATFPKYAIVSGFRRVESDLRLSLDSFFRGEESEFLSLLFQALLARPGARRDSERVQEWLDHLKRFQKRETRPLARVIATTGWNQYPVRQEDRDPIFLMARFAEETKLIQP